MSNSEELYNQHKNSHKDGVILKDQDGNLFKIMNLTWDEKSVICTYINVNGSQMMRSDPINSVLLNFEIVPPKEL